MTAILVLARRCDIIYGKRKGISQRNDVGGGVVVETQSVAVNGDFNPPVVLVSSAGGLVTMWKIDCNLQRFCVGSSYERYIVAASAVVAEALALIAERQCEWVGFKADFRVEQGSRKGDVLLE